MENTEESLWLACAKANVDSENNTIKVIESFKTSLENLNTTINKPSAILLIPKDALNDLDTYIQTLIK